MDWWVGSTGFKRILGICRMGIGTREGDGDSERSLKEREGTKILNYGLVDQF